MINRKKNLSLQREIGRFPIVWPFLKKPMYYVLPIGKVAALNVSMLAFSFKDMQTEMILGNELLSMTSPLLVDHMPLHLKARNMTFTYHKTMKFAPPHLL